MTIIHGAITLKSPLHTSAGFQGLRLSADGTVSSNSTQGISVVSTMTTPLTVRGRYYGQVPLFPSSGVIGALRRAATLRVRNALLSGDNKKMPVHAFFAFSHGQPAAAQLGNTLTLEQYNAVRKNPFFGLFGGATLRNASQFIVSDLYPIIGATLDAGLVPQRLHDLAPIAKHDLEPHNLLHYRVMRKVDDLRRGTDMLGGSDVELSEYDTQAKTEAAAAYQCVPTGTSFYFKLSLLPNVSAEQKGLLLLALRDWLEQGQIGARAHLGWGQFTAHRIRYIDGDTRLDLFDMNEDDEGIATLLSTPDFDKLTTEANELLERYRNCPAQARNEYLQLLKGEAT